MGAEALQGQRVRCHFNLQKKRWSITHKGKVVARGDQVELANARPIVSAAGLKRVRRVLGKRWVVAWVEGELVSIDGGASCDELRRVSFNPWKADTFYHSDDSSEWVGSSRVVFQDAYAWVQANG